MNRVGRSRGDKCQPAHGIIVKLGGVRALARELALDPSALSKWTTTLKRGGGGGLIPSRYFHGILAVARAKGIRLSADDLIGNGTR
jgi:transposase-like protein